VVAEVTLDGLLHGVRALEVLVAFLGGVGARAGVHVFVDQLSDVIGQGDHVGEGSAPLESGLGLAGKVAEVFGFAEDFADQLLLAFEVVIVELLVELLHHVDGVEKVELGHVIVGSILGLVVVLPLVVRIVALVIIVSVIGRAAVEETAGIDKISDNAEKDGGANEG